MARRDSRLSRMGETKQEWKDRTETNKKLAFERKVVRKLLTGVGVSAVEIRVKEPDAGTPNADFYLTLGWVHDEFPTIPVRLMAHEIPDPNRDMLYEPWKRKGLWSAWSRVEKEFAGEKDDYGIGCIFNVVGWGIMVVHNVVFPRIDLSAMRKGHVQLSWEYEDNIVRLETLDTFIVQLGNIWRPRE